MNRLVSTSLDPTHQTLSFLFSRLKGMPVEAPYSNTELLRTYP